MPELPEVETTRRGIERHITHKTIDKVCCQRQDLRWPIPFGTIKNNLPGKKIIAISRRGKYLLLNCEVGWLIIHLGMSGSLRVVPMNSKRKLHDHFELFMDSGLVLRLNDPRRFGAVLWEPEDPLAHRLIKLIAPEPLGNQFNRDWLFNKIKRRQASIKPLIMNNEIVAGVGNIYANESLFKAKIHPLLPGEKLTKERCQILVKAIKETLRSAIKCGGSSLKDYVNADGIPGYFQQNYNVYNREKLPCKKCESNIIKKTYFQRATYFCKNCQKIN